MWTTPDDDPRTYGNPVGELATYREYLVNYRLTIEMKCEGLGADQLARRSVPPSTLSLVGLVRHLAQMENHWFQRMLQGRTDLPRLYKREDDPDWDFAGATSDPEVVREAFATWKAEMAKADEWLDALEESTWAARSRSTLAAPRRATCWSTSSRSMRGMPATPISYASASTGVPVCEPTPASANVGTQSTPLVRSAGHIGITGKTSPQQAESWRNSPLDRCLFPSLLSNGGNGGTGSNGSTAGPPA
jgi:hypothetical protein